MVCKQTTTYRLTPKQFERDVQILANKIKASSCHYTSIYGIPRGGSIIAVKLGHLLGLPLIEKPTRGTLVCDDVSDTGDTLGKFEGFATATLHRKDGTRKEPTFYVRTINKWIIYFWEERELLSPFYVAGLVEGEGCFCLSLNKNQSIKLGWEARPLFDIMMDNKNEELLKSTCKVIGLPLYVVRTYPRGVYLTTQKISHLEIIVKFFEKYPLIGPKRAQFDVWKIAVKLKKDRKTITREGLREYIRLREEVHRSTKSKRKWRYNDVVL